jgi:hypothetical protein
MKSRPSRALAVCLIALVASACGSPAPSSSRIPPATSYDEYAVAFCSAFDSLFRAVGNPDTASGSELSKSLDQAVAAGDGPSADRLAGAINAELEAGRQQVAAAGGWQPAAAMMTELDRVFVAFEAMTEAKRAKARAPDARDPQAAFEGAGGIDAWRAMFAAAQSVPRPSDGTDRRCPTVPVSP